MPFLKYTKYVKYTKYNWSFWENVMSLSTLNMSDFSLKYTNFAGHPPSPPGGVYIPLLVYLSPFEPMDLKYLLRPMDQVLGDAELSSLGSTDISSGSSLVSAA